MLGLIAVVTALIPIVAAQISTYHCSLNRTGFFQPQATIDGPPIWLYQNCALGTVCFPDYSMELSPCRYLTNDTCYYPAFDNYKICAGLDNTNSILECNTTSRLWTVRSCGDLAANCGPPTTSLYGNATCGEGEESPVHMGHILVKYLNPSTGVEERAGYLSVEQGYNTSFRVLDSIEKALTVQFTHTDRFSIIALNPLANQVNRYVGAVAGGEGEAFSIAAGSDKFAFVTGTQKTDLGATPAFGANSYTALMGNPRVVESEIWSLSNEDELTAKWVNPDEAVTDVTVVLHLHHPYTYFLRVFLTGDFEKFSATMGGYAAVGKLYFEPIVSNSNSGQSRIRSRSQKFVSL